MEILLVYVFLSSGQKPSDPLWSYIPILCQLRRFPLVHDIVQENQNGKLAKECSQMFRKAAYFAAYDFVKLLG